MLEVERPLIEARLDLDECLNGQPDLQARQTRLVSVYEHAYLY